jgi:putative methionine-R-sulfoxide reductase with GAF domain
LDEENISKSMSPVRGFSVVLMVFMLIATVFLILIQNFDKFSQYFGGTMLKIATDVALLIFVAVFAVFILLKAGQYHKRLEVILDQVQKSNMLLKVLNSIQSSANADMDTERLLRESLDSAMPLTSSIGTIYLLDDNSSKLKARASYGMDISLEKIPEYDIGEGLAGKAAAYEETIEDRAAGKSDEDKPDTLATMARIAIPIRAGNKVSGVLMAATQKGSYSDEEKTLLHAVSEVLGNSLVNARLYDITRRALDNSKRTQSYLESFILEAKMGVLVVDSKGMVLIANREAERYLNLQAKDILGKNAFDTLNSVEGRGNLLIQAFQSCFANRLGAQFSDSMNDKHETIALTVNVFPLFGNKQELIGAAATVLKA